MKTLILYTTSACHLCELAEELICTTLDFNTLQVEAVDIAESDELVERYGVRIPVLCDGPRELGWPFDRAQLQAFLQEA